MMTSTGHGGQNPKSKIQNPKQIPMNKGASPQNQAAAGGLIGRVLRICHLNLVLVSHVEFRISGLSSQGSGVQPKRCGTCSGEMWRWLRWLLVSRYTGCTVVLLSAAWL